MNAQQVYRTVGAGSEQAMLQAERTGQGTANGAVIIHAGYTPDASYYDASTSLYQVRW